MKRMGANRSRAPREAERPTRPCGTLRPVDNASIPAPSARLDRAAHIERAARLGSRVIRRARGPGLACAAALALSSAAAMAEDPPRPAARKPAATSSAPAHLDEAPAPARDNAALQRSIGVFTGMTGLAGLATSGVFGILSLYRWKAVTSDRETCVDAARLRGCPQPVKDAQVTASSYATISTYSFATGLVALAGGITIWYTAPRVRAAAPQVGLAPVPLPGGVAAVFSGAF
jgi:hypothetical protein